LYICTTSKLRWHNDDMYGSEFKSTGPYCDLIFRIQREVAWKNCITFFLYNKTKREASCMMKKVTVKEIFFLSEQAARRNSLKSQKNIFLKARKKNIRDQKKKHRKICYNKSNRLHIRQPARVQTNIHQHLSKWLVINPYH